MIIKTTAHLACPDHTHDTHDTHAKQAMPYFPPTKFVHYFSANRSPSAKLLLLLLLLLLPFLIENNNNNNTRNNHKPAIIITKQQKQRPLKLYWITTCPVSPPHTYYTMLFLTPLATFPYSGIILGQLLPHIFALGFYLIEYPWLYCL